MKKFINISLAIIFAATFTGITNAQEMPVVPKIPKEVPKTMPPNVPTEKTVNDSAEAEGEEYDVPFIGKENLKEGKAKLTAEIEELTAEALVESGASGTQLKISMSNVDKIAKDKTFFVWLATGEGKYTKIGKVAHSEKNPTAEIKGRVPIDKFGILITVEDGQVDKPTSKTYVAFKQEASE